jgi:hypothetical protein
MTNVINVDVCSICGNRNFPNTSSHREPPGGTGEAEKRIAKRPPQAHITAAFNDLLDKIELKNCRTNDGYLKALGMTPSR